MSVKVITGQIVCQPVVINDENEALVLVVVKSNEQYTELHYTRHRSSLHKSLSWNYANSMFSKIATSSIGETVEVEISHSTGEIFSFKNITREGVMCK